jgi:hypothetical protein
VKHPTIASEAQFRICPLCEESRLVFSGLNEARCPACDYEPSNGFLITLRQIVTYRRYRKLAEPTRKRARARRLPRTRGATTERSWPKKTIELARRTATRRKKREPLTKFEEGEQHDHAAIRPGRSRSLRRAALEVLNGGAMAIMTSIGHRTGLFDAMAGYPPPPASRSPRRPTSTSATCASGWAP